MEIRTFHGNQFYKINQFNFALLDIKTRVLAISNAHPNLNLILCYYLSNSIDWKDYNKKLMMITDIL